MELRRRSARPRPRVRAGPTRAPRLRPRPPAVAPRGGPFTGRDEELARLDDATRGAVLLAGEPGIGKTRLLAEAARIAHRRGAVVRYGRCYEEQVAPYEPFAEALGADTFAALADAADGERWRLFEAVARAAGREPCCVLDDLHWADAGTLRLLAHVLRRPRRAARARRLPRQRGRPLPPAGGDARRPATRRPGRAPAARAAWTRDAVAQVVQRATRRRNSPPGCTARPAATRSTSRRCCGTSTRPAGPAAGSRGREGGDRPPPRPSRRRDERVLADRGGRGPRVRPRAARAAFSTTTRWRRSRRRAGADGARGPGRPGALRVRPRARARDALRGAQPGAAGSACTREVADALEGHRRGRARSPMTACRRRRRRGPGARRAREAMVRSPTKRPARRAAGSRRRPTTPAADELLLGLGEARLARRGERPPGVHRAAAQAAREQDEHELLARAALGFGGLGVTIIAVDRRPSRCSKRRCKPPGRPSAPRRLLGRLAIETYYASTPESAEGAAATRRSARPQGARRPRLLDALDARHAALWSAEYLDERLATARRCSSAPPPQDPSASCRRATGSSAT